MIKTFQCYVTVHYWLAVSIVLNCFIEFIG